MYYYDKMIKFCNYFKGSKFFTEEIGLLIDMYDGVKKYVNMSSNKNTIQEIH